MSFTIKNSIVNEYQLVLLFFILCISWSPLVPNLIYIANSYLYIISILSLIFFNYYISNSNNRILFIFCIIYILIIYIISIFLSVYSFGNLLLPFPLSLLLAELIIKNNKLLESLIFYTSIFAIISIICCIIGLIYGYLGIDPIYMMVNPDGRENLLYLTTFSNEINNNIIRASFIYDEPGALSFFLCFVVFMRILQRKNNFISEFILLGGMVTFSLMHFIICFLYVVIKKRRYIAPLLALYIFLYIFTDIDFSNIEFFTNRFKYEDGRFIGDNRSNQLTNFINLFDYKIFFLGNYECFNSKDFCSSINGDITSNIFSPMYGSGIMGALTQIICIGSLAYSLVKKSDYFVCFSMILILLQRPFFSGIGYSLMILLIIFNLLKIIKTNNEKNT